MTRAHSLFWLSAFLISIIGACSEATPRPSPPKPSLGELDQLLAHAQPSRLQRTSDGFRAVLEGRASGSDFRSAIRPARVNLPATADGAIGVSTGGGRVALSRRGVDGTPGRLADGVLRHEAERVGVVAFASDHVLEELFVVQAPAALGYDVDLPEGWSLAVVGERVVELRDTHRRAQLRIAAERAWDANGDEVALSLVVEDDGLAIHLGEVGAWPVYVDPTFVDASVPLKLRQRHTATLLTDGRVLIAGGDVGGIPDATVEIYDPVVGTTKVIEGMGEARSGHSATMLMDGRVLIAGGEDVSADLVSTETFDPATETFSAGPPLSVTRAGHTATRLDDGRVLLAGGGDQSADVYDPVADTVTATGTMPTGFFLSAAALLEDGRVLLLGVGGTGSVSTLFDASADSGAGAFSSLAAGPQSFEAGGSSLTRLRDGRLLALGGCPCASVGGPFFTSENAEIYDPGTQTWSQTGDQARARTGHTATLLPSGNVLVTGGNDSNDPNEEQSSEIYDVALGQFTSLTNMTARHRNHTATLLASGEVLIFGGTEAAFELYAGGVRGAFANTTDTNVGRLHQTMTLLTTGEVLVTGNGLIAFTTPSDTAELFDPASNTYSDTGVLNASRTHHAAVLLHDGDVLVTGGQDGGALSSAELYNRTAGTFTAIASMQQARSDHAMVTLPGGDVLVVGGAGDTAERYAASTSTFSATAMTMTRARARPAAALLPNGKVLIVSDTTAELYDPATDSFAAIQGPGASYTSPHIVVLQTGRALLTGSYTQAAELFDVDTQSFSFTGPDAVGRAETQLVLLPNGLAMELGGENLATERTVYGTTSLFHPLGGEGQGVFDDAATMLTRTTFGAVVLADGDVLVTGGEACLDICFGPPQPSQRWSFVGDPAWRPSITTAPAMVEPGSLVSLSGTAFTGPEAGGGRANASATNHPVVSWQPLDQSATIAGTIESWTATTANWRVPSTAYFGPGWLRVTVAGVPSRARLVEIQVAPGATGCVYDAECASGFCTDGVCCDSRCGDRCEACTAALQGSGADGVCGAVPPERDPDDDCVLSPGAPCDDAVQCDSGLCVDGLCCDSACTGQCEACDVEGSEGQCVPVSGAPHGARPACDAEAPTDACDAAVCDGTNRTACDGTIGPCIPYACTVDGCLDNCGTDTDCAIGHHCEDGVCLTGQCDGTIATTPEGQVIDCAPYICQADGSCRTSCADVSDCADPFGCDFAGRCVQRPPNDVPSDCACRAVGTGSGSSRAGWLAGLLLLGCLVRRRRGGALALASLSVCLLMVTAVFADEEQAPPPPEPEAEAAPPSPDQAELDEEAEQKRKKAEALQHFRKGIALIDSGAWRPALAEFLRSRELYATRVATKNAAACYEQLERYDDALSMHEAMLRDFDDLDEEERGGAQRAIVKLKKLVGTIEIDDAEVGSAIVIDGTHRGTYPLPSPLRAAAGTHIVRVYKEGFEPFESRVDLAGGATARLSAKLAALKETGLLKVTEAKGRKLEVLVDNVAVGETPWEGRLSPGEHTVRLAGQDKLGTAPVPAPVKAEKTTTLSLEAKLLDATLRIEPTPANASVSLDAVVLGRGVWEGALPSGSHTIEIIAEGFFTATKKVKLDKGGHQDLAVVLERDDDADIWAVPGKITIDAIGAGALVPTFGGDVVTGCEGDCSAGVGLGGHAKLSVGYELPGGFGFGAFGGYLALSQDVEGRDTLVQPVGLSTRQGTANDKLSLSGPFVGAFASYLFDMDYPILVRLGAGPVFTTVRDERTSSFPVDEGGAYQAGPIAQDPTAIYLMIDPEVRLGMKLGDNFQLSLGLEIPILVALELPAWDAAREIDAAEDGIGAFGSESLTGRVVVGLAPSLGARAHF